MRSLKNNLAWYLLLILLVADVLIWYAIFKEERGDLTVAFLDVGQGDAIFIEAPNGNQMLVDSGKNARVLRELSSVMPFYDRSIDVVLATHPDQDHIGGLPEVLGRYSASFFVDPGIVNDTAAYRALLSAVQNESVPHIIARRSMKIILDNNIFFLVLFPDRDVSSVDTNDGSIVGQLIYGDTTFLFTGDAPQKIENFIASLDGKALHSDVLKVGHHGSKTSTSELFLGFVSPEVSVISAGVSNPYGHPHKEVIDRLLHFGSTILRTDKQGTIIIKSDGDTVRY